MLSSKYETVSSNSQCWKHGSQNSIHAIWHLYSLHNFNMVIKWQNEERISFLTGWIFINTDLQCGVELMLYVYITS